MYVCKLLIILNELLIICSYITAKQDKIESVIDPSVSTTPVIASSVVVNEDICTGKDTDNAETALEHPLASPPTVTTRLRSILHKREIKTYASTVSSDSATSKCSSNDTDLTALHAGVSISVQNSTKHKQNHIEEQGMYHFKGYCTTVSSI